MKKTINISRWLSLLGFLILFATACNKPDDKLTKDAKTGGLIEPTLTYFYKLGKTTKVDIGINVPTGPAISQIFVYNTFIENDSTQSNEVLLTTLSNITSIDSLHLTYADLAKNLVLNGGPMPAADTSLPIGSSFLLRYEVKMGDGRRLVNLATTTIGISNFFAGSYHDQGFFHHPTAGTRVISEDKNLVAINAFQCTTTVADLGGNGYMMKINIDPATNVATVISIPDSGSPDLIMSTDQQSTYDPVTGVIKLFYFYVGATGNRVIEETYTPK